MTTALPESINASAPQGSQGSQESQESQGLSDIQVEVANGPLPLGMRLDCRRSDVSHRVRHARPRLPSFPAAVPVVPAVGVATLGLLLVRDRRRAVR